MRVEDQEGAFSVSDEGALMPGRLPLILLAIMVCVGCADPHVSPPKQSDTQSADHHVVLDVRVLVVGSHPPAVTHAIKDLRQVGFAVAQGDLVRPMLHAQEFGPGVMFNPHSSSLSFGHPSQADVIVLVEVSGPMAYPRVSVKGIDLETGELLWRGDAAHLRGVGHAEYDRAVMELTHRALFDGLHKPTRGAEAVLSYANDNAPGAAK